MSEVGNVIKELRGKMSLREASEKIGISHTYLDTIEKGFDKRSGKRINPSPDTLRLISKAYRYPYKSLLNLAGYIDGDNEGDLNEDDIDAEIKEITDKINVWYKNEPEDKELKLRMLRKMLESFEEE